MCWPHRLFSIQITGVNEEDTAALVERIKSFAPFGL
jgi:hypothetical protein